MAYDRIRPVRGVLVSAAVFALSSCGGGGGSTGAPAFVPGGAPTPTPVPTATPPAVSSSAGTVSQSGPTTVSLPPAAGGVSGTVVLTAASTTATVALTLSATPPAGAPSLQSNRRLTQAIGAPATGLAYLTAQASADISFNSTFGTNISVPGPVTGAEYLVMYDPANARAGWVLVSVPGTASAGIAPGFGNIALTFAKGATYDLALISTQSTLTLPLPSPTPSTIPSPTATPAATATPTDTPSPSPSPTPTATPAPTPAPTPLPTATPIPTPTPTPTPTPAPTPGAVVANIPSLQFLGVGTTFAQTIIVTQANYDGLFALGGTSCNGLTAVDTTVSLQNFTITPLAAGTCSYTLTGGGGVQIALPVTVTTLTIGGH